jgi:hypothetical protein
VARSIDDAGWRAPALAEVAQRLPADEQRNVLAEALSAARSTDDVAGRARALAKVAQHLPAEERRSLLAEAVSAARASDDVSGRRALALADIARRLGSGQISDC